MKTLLARWEATFWTGLAVVLPAAVSIGLILWLFGTVAHFTDTLLVFLPAAWTHAEGGAGPLHLYWSVIALVVAILMVCVIGGLARYYFGKQLIRLVDVVFMRVPLLNKIYSTLKQINAAFTSSKAANFKQVVLVEFPRAGLYSIGFLTNTPADKEQSEPRRHLVSVFVPTPPLTSGAIVLVPEADVFKLDVSVADGIKFIMSLGSISPPCLSQANHPGLRMAGPHQARVKPEALALFDRKNRPEFLTLPRLVAE